MKIEGAIFDLDGTLLDSMGIWNTVGEEYLRSLGILPEENLAETLKEMSLSQSAAYFQTKYGVAKSEKEIIDGINALVERFYIEDASLKAGVKEALEMLAEKHVKMCIATATDEYLVDKALVRCGARHYFSKIFTCSEVGHGKDEPDIYKAAFTHLGTPIETTIVFEDALHAIKTAKKAGFSVVGIFDRLEPDQEKVRALADDYLESFIDFSI